VCVGGGGGERVEKRKPKRTEHDLCRYLGEDCRGYEQETDIMDGCKLLKVWIKGVRRRLQMKQRLESSREQLI
jgi:hypothetical protein